jgi:hypothetical protein
MLPVLIEAFIGIWKPFMSGVELARLYIGNLPASSFLRT